MCIAAHPDDESFGMGGTLAKYAGEGVETAILMATRGERGRYGLAEASPGPEIVGAARTQELLAAAARLGVTRVDFLDYMDAELDQAPPGEIIPAIARHIRREKPQVVITFGPEGGYGHPDHIAISQFATAAIVRAADPAFETPGVPHHSVLKLYYIAWTSSKWAVFQTVFKKLISTVDGIQRAAAPCPDWQVTTRLDTAAYWPIAWEAILCHKTQVAIYGNLEKLSPAQHRILWGQQEYYRVFSLVNGGRKPESDLFEGIA
ncbi:MAG: PIG-L family deacetylase [Saprospiraceae bacterium]|nr:PIG-L family deacetylase [Lewinellaceae bacterium]